MRNPERPRSQVLPGVRCPPVDGLSVLRQPEPTGQVLRRVRFGARGRGRCVRRASGRRSGATPDRAPPGLGPVPRPGVVHHALRATRRRRHAFADGRVLRRCADRDRTPRRRGREVHRGRGHGGVGDAGHPRGRRRASGPCRPRARGRGRRARCLDGPSAAGSRRRADGGGGHLARRREPGHGHGRHGEHRVPAAVRRRAGSGVRGRGDVPRRLARRGLRRGGRPHAEGQGGVGTRMARPPRGRRAPGSQPQPGSSRRSWAAPRSSVS